MLTLAVAPSATKMSFALLNQSMPREPFSYSQQKWIAARFSTTLPKISSLMINISLSVASVSIS